MMTIMDGLLRNWQKNQTQRTFRKCPDQMNTVGLVVILIGENFVMEDNRDVSRGGRKPFGRMPNTSITGRGL
jgi:hypothetical protein